MVLAALRGGNTIAAAQCPYEVTFVDLPPGVCDHANVFPQSINDHGTVVGYWQCTLGEPQPFIWREEFGLIPLPMPPGFVKGEAWDVNNHDVVVGTMGFTQRGFIFDFPAGQWTILEPEPTGTHSGAFGINDAGQVVGYRDPDDDDPHMRLAFRWENGAFTHIPPLFGPTSLARDINDHGDVVGWMGISVGIDAHAFLFRDGQLTDLGLLPNSDSSTGTGINGSVEIAVGMIYTDDHPQGLFSGGFRWANGRFTDIGMLDGYDSMAVNELSADGDIIGFCRTIDTPHLIRSGVPVEGRRHNGAGSARIACSSAAVHQGGRDQRRRADRGYRTRRSGRGPDTAIPDGP